MIFMQLKHCHPSSCGMKDVPPQLALGQTDGGLSYNSGSKKLSIMGINLLSLNSIDTQFKVTSVEMLCM